MEEFDEDLQRYINMGVVKVSGIDESGEFIFLLDESAKQLAPELWKIHTDYIDQTLLELFEKDLLSVSYDENLEATFEITEEGKRLAREMGIVSMDPDFDLE